MIQHDSALVFCSHLKPCRAHHRPIGRRRVELSTFNAWGVVRHAHFIIPSMCINSFYRIWIKCAMVKTGVVYLVHAYAQHKGLDHSYVFQLSSLCISFGFALAWPFLLRLLTESSSHGVQDHQLGMFFHLGLANALPFYNHGCQPLSKWDDFL